MLTRTEEGTNLCLNKDSIPLLILVADCDNMFSPRKILIDSKIIYAIFSFKTIYTLIGFIIIMDFFL